MAEAEIIKEEGSFREIVQKVIGSDPGPMVIGRLQRFDINRKNDNAGWYVIHSTGDFTTYLAGDWTTGKKIKWFENKSESLEIMPETRAKIEIDRARYDAEQDRKRLLASKKAYAIYKTLPVAPNSFPYLIKKKVKNINSILKYDERDNTIIVPVWRSDGKLVSLEKISEDGEKRFLSGGEKRGCYCILGRPSDRAFLCEGYATGASIYAATGTPVVVAFDGNNMSAVAEVLSSKLKLCVVADNDQKIDGSNPGKSYAEATGLPYIMIPESGMDANDYAVKYGLGNLKGILNERNLMQKTNTEKFDNITRDTDSIVL